MELIYNLAVKHSIEGRNSSFCLGLKGLSGISGNEWYRNVVLNDLPFSDDDLIEYAMPSVIRQFSGKIPIHKYLAGAKENHLVAMQMAKETNFDSIISNTIRKNRKKLADYTSVKQIWEDKKSDMKKACELMAYLQENQFSLSELENVLQEIFNEDVNILENANGAGTEIRRLIKIYDWLKYGKTKEPSN